MIAYRIYLFPTLLRSVQLPFQHTPSTGGSPHQLMQVPNPSGEHHAMATYTTYCT